ncbi:helix-hairpin-helix domain-containing protein [Candidatus Micrarchaeota archaeon]|nr:helix-hairpin-helix domain-containing protein [Candidatus Micrarchaeota archaeon]
MQQFLDPPDSSRVSIAVDQREDAAFDALFRAMGANVQRQVLAVGDFLCSSRLAVERKTRSDFEQSVIDGRLFSQLPNLVANYERVAVVVEGISNDERLSRESLLGAYASIIADFGASVIFTRDKMGTAELVFALAKHEQLAKKVPMRIYARKRTFTPSQTARSIVESLPMVGPKLAKALLAHFGNVEALAQATERDIAAVPGVGNKRAKVIRAVLTYRYSEEEDRSVY